MKRGIFLILICSLLKVSSAQNLETPGWVKDLIIYEISTRSFTSPDGRGSGTFQSLMKKIPYLVDLGINGVWLTGHNWADDHHFYGIWTQYATFRPDSIDPKLGTRQDLKQLIEEFHKNGIKVFLDIVTHGVMNNSPLIKEHPLWFKGGSWGMTDYDWYGNHKDLDEWWVKTHVEYVLKQGIDGYRLDVNVYRPDLWKEIKRQCASAGHPIIIFHEREVNNENVVDFFQRMQLLSHQQRGIDTASVIISNPARFFTEKASNKNHYTVYIRYHDGKQDVGSTLRGGKLAVKKIFEPAIKPAIIKPRVDDENNYIDLLIGNIDTSKRIANISVGGEYFAYESNWQLGSTNEWLTRMKPGNSMHIYLKPFVPDIYYYSVQLSSHDDGWENFPEGLNPYVAEGSRCLFGFNFLFTPAIPLFMSGEEFDAEFIPNPGLTPGLFGKGKPGTGKWLYGGIIDWDQLTRKQHAEMLQDVKKMISIRKTEKDIFQAYRNDTLPDIFELKYECDKKIPVPFAIMNNEKIIIVAGNNSSQDVVCTINLPLEKIKLNPEKTYKVSNLWNNTNLKVKGKDLRNLTFPIKRDKTAGGGLAVFKIQKDNSLKTKKD